MANSDEIVDPWSFTGISEEGVDYDKLIKTFDTTKIDSEMLERFEKVTKRKPHHLLRRGLFFCHRDMNWILDTVESGELFYLCIGRIPSSKSMHLGHLVLFNFTKWLQSAFNVPLIIQLTDDEKFLWNDIDLEDTKSLAIENAKDIIALGFNAENTFIFSDFKYMGECSAFYENVIRIQKCIKYDQVKEIFGFNDSSPIGQIIFPSVQAAPAFSSSFPIIFNEKKKIPCLIPCTIDQDPYYRILREVATTLNYSRPALLHCKFFPALQGNKIRTGSPDPNSLILLTDNAKQIKNKIKNYAYSGGIVNDKKKERNLNLEICYQYLTFLHTNDEKVMQIKEEFTTGNMSNNEIKKETIDLLIPIILAHQEARKFITDEAVQRFMVERSLEKRDI